MPRGKPSPKITITIDPTVYEGIVAAAEDEGASVSAWLTEAAREALLRRDGMQAIREWEEENGPFTEAEMRRARAHVRAEMRRR